ncbi:branched-chain amino acid ABC transporter permease [Halomarina litorea]|uniref:branched-chain amino acid ABC transporter permease n=1 Tax=Halomarina litorea TaxID=2961595 RepID=UPI0020C44495|nr:branched-chain amino acid ABC transporter permease [Halomarina sp. BCD28]
MGVSDTYSRGRDLAVERPGALVVGVVGMLLLLDLIRRLATGVLDPSQFATYVWTGLVIGLVYGLAGIGLSLTYSILNFANFAHGEYVTTGAFSGWAVAYVVAGAGAADLGSRLLVQAAPGAIEASITSTPVAIVLGLVAAMVLAVALSLVLDRVVYKPMRGQEGISLLIASIGVAFALRYLLSFVFGNSTRGVTGGTVKTTIGGVVLNAHDVTLVVIALVLMLGVHLVLQTTKLGKAMRAMADNEDLARVTGIPTERVIRWTWIIGGGLAGAAGYLVVLKRGTIAFDFGWILLLLIFAAVILGGIGSVYGAMLGGVLIGIAENVSLVWLSGPWTDFTTPVAFGLMILILLFRPEGIFGGVSTA